MHVEKVLKVGAEEFFEQISHSVEQDIYATTNKKVKVDQLKEGFTYEKNLNNKVGRSNRVTVEIVEIHSPSSYIAKFTSRDGTNTISYRIEELGPQQIKVYYQEDFKGATKAKNLNAKIMQLLYNFNSKKRTNKLLCNIETYIIDNR